MLLKVLWKVFICKCSSAFDNNPQKLCRKLDTAVNVGSELPLCQRFYAAGWRVLPLQKVVDFVVIPIVTGVCAAPAYLRNDVCPIVSIQPILPPRAVFTEHDPDITFTQRFKNLLRHGFAVVQFDDWFTVYQFDFAVENYLVHFAI